jgi:hypothetical protein
MNDSELEKKLPKQCDICKDEIKLYKPYYTVMVRPHFTQLKESGIKVFCPDCFHAYENFLIEHEVQENHKRNYQEMKGV